jgi:hypothetical protein
MIEHGVAVVGWSVTGGIEGLGSLLEVRRRLIAAYADADSDIVDSWAEQLWAFATRIRVGDEVAVVVLPDGLLATGTVTGPYRFDAAAPENRRHQLPVHWAGRAPIEGLDERLRGALDSGLTVAAVPADAGRDAPSQVSRRTLLLGGAAALGAAGGAVALRSWRAGSHDTASASGSRGGPRRPAAVRPTPRGPVAQWVVDENAKQGTSNWNVTNPGPEGAIEGYSDVVSTPLGMPITLYVSTVDPTFRVEAYRLGYYKGAFGRLVWQSDPVSGVEQAAPTIAPGTNMVEANWSPSLQIPIDHRFPPGVYLLKLVGSSGIERLVPLTVRDDASTAAYMVQCSVTTWQAYNDWGGYSLYKGPDGSFANRARVVSFDRPYRLGAGQSDFLGLDFPLIMLMEQLGLDLAYSTDVDTHAHPERLLHHRTFFSHGHDEYWSKEMRDGVEAARDAGVNLVFLGSNAAFRQIRFDASPLGPNRRQICYKSTDDPIRRTNPALTTVNWREPPVIRPESAMIGQQYESNPVRADMIIVDPAAWIFDGLGLVAGQALAGIVGSEYDHYLPSEVGPQNVQILAHSPVVCRGVKSFADMTYYTAPSGAGVLATGTLDWIPALAPPGLGPSYDPTVVAITKNILAAFGHTKVGGTHPSLPNFDAIAQQYGTTNGLATGTD